MERATKREIRKRYTIRLLQTELETMQKKAQTAGITVSEYVRKCTQNKNIRSRVNAQVIGQISRLCGLQKHLLMQIKNHPYEETLRKMLNQTLEELTTTLRTLIKEEQK